MATLRRGAKVSSMPSRIEDYGIIGNTRTVALVSRAGSIDWMCAPDFDSDACFASLVGYDAHGRWSLRPTVPVRQIRQRYINDTLILETEFECDGGIVRLIDFMPPSNERSDVIRILEGVAGEVPMELELVPRFGYGSDRPRVLTSDDGAVIMTAGPDSLILRADVPARVRDAALFGEHTIRQGERVACVLSWFASHHARPPALDVDRERARTDAYWTAWANRCPYHGRYREPVMRSLITLKALTYAPTGAVAAATTAGLPEQIGGPRNWDYRYCWIRDASLTLRALMFGGYTAEAAAFREWVLRAAAGDPEQMQIMYDIRGGRRLIETELPFLPGYEGSRPVRIGNAAHEQFQLDIYGELIGALDLGERMGLPRAESPTPLLGQILDHVERVWQSPDDGIWEVRGGRRHFTHSKLMAWVAVASAVNVIERRGPTDPLYDRLPHLRGLRERIHDEVCARGFNPRKGAFTQYYGGEVLDASVLVMTHTGFLPANDARVCGTVAAVERELLRDGFVLRYSTEHGVDGLPGSEGAFLACSFWLADNYTFAGRFHDAEALLERLLGLRNHLGLLAEEYEPRLQRQIGNFPQGFSHLALVQSVATLEQAAARRHEVTTAASPPQPVV
jgi:GH15 family glucan-1,4-alpha-glucosidase